MNDDVEKLLKELAPAPPSEQLDKRINQLLVSATVAPRTPMLRRPVPLWLCAATCVLCVALGFLSRMLAPERRAPAAEPTQVIHIIYTDPGATRPVFDWTKPYEPFWNGNAERTTVVVPAGNGQNVNPEDKV